MGGRLGEALPPPASHDANVQKSLFLFLGILRKTPCRCSGKFVFPWKNKLFENFAPRKFSEKFVPGVQDEKDESS